VCSEHFEDDDFKFVDSRIRRLKDGACPSVFLWSKPKTERSLPARKARLEKEKEIMEAEETETASEGEGSYEGVNEKAVSRGIQVNIEVVCSHRMSVSVLRSRCTTHKIETKLFSHFAGFRKLHPIKRISRVCFT